MILFNFEFKTSGHILFVVFWSKNGARFCAEYKSIILEEFHDASFHAGLCFTDYTLFSGAGEIRIFSKDDIKSRNAQSLPLSNLVRINPRAAKSSSSNTASPLSNSTHKNG
jgi:hypothetical protein